MNTEHLQALRHSCAHLLAAAVKTLYPHARETIGPAIDAGFYYDFDFGGKPLSENDLPAIEQKMRELVGSWDSMNRAEITPERARELYADNPYKLEIIEDCVREGQTLTLYTSGDFTDLCRGGHVDNPAKSIVHFKLLSLAGAYWRGSEKNPMLTRIYGTCFETAEELSTHLHNIEEAKKRDHRKIGKDLELFCVDDEFVGKGLILWLPNGTVMRDAIEEYAKEKEEQYGYARVCTPHLAKEKLFLTSGHLPYYKESMYPEMVMDDGTYYLKAMNCPHHHIIYTHKKRSYRDLPVRLAEYGTVYRNELSGTLAGLLRVRALTMNDAHIYCRKDQIKDEFKKVLELMREYFDSFGLSQYWFRLSKWDPNHTEKYINEPEHWTYTESVIREVLEELKLPFVEVIDEAAFYGPKIDIQFTSAIGREETMSTVQLDFAAKQRFGLSYTDSSGNTNGDVFVIHRAPLSTHERFMAFLIEHYAGLFPVWLSPIQLRIISVGEKHHEFATSLHAEYRAAGIRADLDLGNETVGKKIRAGAQFKIPYMIVVGDKEMASNEFAVKVRGQELPTTLSRENLLARIQDHIAKRTTSLEL